MKKHILAAIVIFTLLITSLTPVYAADYILGDVDGNKSITAADARLALRASVNLEKLSGNAFKAADVDNSGAITASDARMILRASVGLEELDTTTPEERGYYKAGEIWKVNGNCEFTVTGVTTHSLCNKYSNESNNLTNEQVIIVKFAYKNAGYNKYDQGLYMDPYYVYDEKGEQASLYGCIHTNSPSSLIPGTNCTGEEAFVLKNNSKSVTIKIEFFDNNSKQHTATFKVDVGTNKKAPAFGLDIPSSQLNSFYKVGETWTEKNNWEITVTGIKTHSLCNEFSNKDYNYTNEQVVIITYKYKNLGADDELYVDLYNVYDEKGTAGELYACTHTDYDGTSKIGETRYASEAFVLYNDSDFVLLNIDEHDSEGETRTATFKIDIK